MINLDKMTQEEKEKLFEELNKEKEKKQKEKEEQREAYKFLVKETVKDTFEDLKELSNKLSKVKKKVFDEFETIIETKTELYGVKENQQSHSFTTDDGYSIVIGYRIVDSFDDTVHAGIEKIRKWVYSITAEVKQKEIESVINLLLKKDKNGNLKANRVLELRKLSEKIDDTEFTDGVDIIEKAYQPIKSSNFIEAYYKDEKGKRVSLPLSITSVE